MVIATGTVRHGVVEMHAAELPEGATVTVLAREGDETFLLDDEEERRLLAAVHEADRGALVPAGGVLTLVRKG